MTRGPAETPALSLSLDGLGRGRGDATRLARHLDELRDRSERVVRLGEALELADLVLEPLRVDPSALAAEDLRVRGRHGALVLRPELLVQLLAGPDPDELD